MPYPISKPSVDRFKEVAKFVSSCEVLVGHDPHFYKIVLDYFGDTAFIAEDECGSIVGFTFGFASQREPDLFFLWQIRVAKESRGDGTGSRLISALIESAKMKGCKRMRATVIQDNEAAKKLFEGSGFKSLGIFPDHYGEGEDMVIYERYLV